jgi:WD40 repeat protein
MGLGLLAPEQTTAFESHVAECEACCQAVLSVPDDALVSRLRHAVSTENNGVASGATAAVSSGPGSDPADGTPPIPLELASHPRYRVEKLLGTGGMGAVYRAYHRVMERPVALKVINPGLLTRPAVVERFTREVKAAARLSHPNIVTAFDAEQAGGMHFLVMEFVEGTDLGRLVRESGALPVDRACDYVRQAALGLQHAFELGMVHRDLKPHNLMLTPEGRVKILDFGLARFASEAAAAPELTGTGMVLGTVDYIAPEQAESAHQADIRSDIYSLGCTLYHLLAGQPPFPTGTAIQKVMAHVQKQPQPLTELRHDLPEQLMLVLERMMTKNPKDRCQTPAEVAIALEPFAVGTDVGRVPRHRHPAGTTGPDRTLLLRKPAKSVRSRRLVAIATAILFLVAGLLGVAVYRIATDTGELVITCESDDVKVVITRGGKLVDVIDTKTDKQIRLTLRSGEYELELKGAPEGLKLNIKKATLTRGETVLATISREDKMPLAGLVAWWRADGNAKDSAGTNHGTLKGGVTYAPGVKGQAFDFNGIDGQVNMGNAPSLHLSSGDFSVSAWVKFRSLKRPHGNRRGDSQPGDMAIVDKMSPVGTGGEDGWALFKQDDNHFWFGLGAGPDINGLTPASPTTIRSSTSVVPGIWYHVVAVKTAAHFSLYVNGVEEVSKRLPAFKDTNTADLQLGAGDISPLNGLIDEVSVYSRALRPAEVKAFWSAQAPAAKAAAEKVGEVRRFEGHTGDAHYVRYSRDGRYAVSCSGWPNGDGTVRVWEIATGKQIHKFDSPAGPVLCAAFSADGGRILYGTNLNGGIVLIDVATGKEVQRFLGCGGGVYTVTFSRDGRRVLAASAEGGARVWDADTGKELCKFEGHRDRVMGAVFSPDGKRAVSGAMDDSIYLWDVETGAKVQSFEGHKGGVHSVAISPDGGYVLAGSWRDKTLRLWEVATGKLVREFTGHEDHVSRVAFSHDGCRAISGSGDKTVRLWDVATGKELHCFTGHTGGVWGVAFSPDDRYALSASEDRTLRLWRLPPQE